MVVVGSEGLDGLLVSPTECEAVDQKDVTAIVSTVKRALKDYNTPAFAKMIQNCMDQAFSWKVPVEKWEETLLSPEVAGNELVIEGEETALLAKENVATS
ncbi:hypothetical protein J5N97_025551 [Dioscorea zingiberensis]|uniref:Uncharacterized protein n=1 Tax=Dioscorea zingiberensis TaxID=325984 RepID=A0A9D5C8Y5_9LILI|nr:hypothetical protein J5N97_025551 [Dioscorea zingiberensis]